MGNFWHRASQGWLRELIAGFQLSPRAGRPKAEIGGVSTVLGLHRLTVLPLDDSICPCLEDSRLLSKITMNW